MAITCSANLWAGQFAVLRSLVAVSVAALLLPIAGCSDRTGSASEYSSVKSGALTREHVQTLLTPSSKTIDLGIVRQAGREQETFSLENPGTEPVEITRFETSCECLEINLLRLEVGPSQKILAVATLDLGKEPQFLGNLGIEVKGLTAGGKTAFSIVVEVSVRPPHEFERSGGEGLPTTDN